MQLSHITGIFEWFLNLSRSNKRIFSVLVDLCMLFIACWSALSLRLGTVNGVLESYWLICLLAPLCSIPVMIRMGMYRAVIRYVGYRAIWTTLKTVSLGTLIWMAAVAIVDLVPAVPRSTFFIYWMAALVAIGGTRILGRWMFRQFTPVGRSYKNRHAHRALIYGAGASGQQMATAFLISPEVSPLGFVDDDPAIHGTEIMGLRVYNTEELDDLVKRYDVDTVLLAIRDLSVTRKREIVRRLASFGLKVKVMPSLTDVAHGKVPFSNMANIDVVDLLGRDSIDPDVRLLERCIQGRVVLVTGAGGSIGGELCRQVLQNKPRRLIVFDSSEYALYTIEKELLESVETDGGEVEIYPILGTVQDYAHLSDLMRKYSVETVYHAAAYKHVPLVEHNVVAGIRNNLMGTYWAAEAAVQAGVKHFVLISTDKAVRPTNVMGATKRLAEMVLQAISQREANGEQGTRFSMVRFGNVLGSSGSVIPLFRKQIALGGPLTITHPDITRYFMTVSEAASLVIQAGAMGHSGDVFVLDMGEPVKIVDLADKMISLAGYQVKSPENPDGDIEIVYTGLRPGEKLYEELLIGGDVLGTEHPMIMRSSEDFLPWERMELELQQLNALLDKNDYVEIRRKLIELVSGYSPYAEISDFLFFKDDGNGKYPEKIRH